MLKLPTMASLEDWAATSLAWAGERVLNLNSLAQLGLAILAAFIAWRLGPRLGRALREGSGRLTGWAAVRLVNAVALAVPGLLFLLLIQLCALGFDHAGYPNHVLRLVFGLALAWVVIRFSSSFVRDRTLAKVITFVAFLLAALNIAGLIGPTMALLDAMAVTIGTLRLSLLLLLRGTLVLVVLIWLANLMARLAEQRLGTMPRLTPAMHVLIAKLVRASLLTLAVVLALGAVGIDLTAFAVFSGAIGVGLGFGLQKVVSNLVSGVILLIDSSIKPGDVIEVGNSYGWITRMNARYVSVITRDGTEYLIPNEDLITQRVINWTYSSDAVRLRVKVSVSYDCDVRQAMQLCQEAARKADRVLAEPAPNCLLVGFGDSAVDLELRFWIGDPRNGTANISSAVRLGIWDAFKENGIDIPFPQREVRLKGPLPEAD
ncbi:MAG TPA: mechanosensitive ion channel domain-containing protein [Aliidongia sp.]|uniref:mechanosensitive ion channel family protein n=1 Tax=Aliidongia sp. TaxID=1914230 RepID=UPI002DDDB088|nr:mechanosensitive ion channel domain-containing protein [Aliidongia sp.]HEV2673518.1 mechanosensitive ion channel domain-containing protein [Aliidongia sp.]